MASTKKPFFITFAGVPGSSKSIVAQHLSVTFNLPIYSNDTVRSEVKEDLLVDSINEPHALAEYERRGSERQKSIFSRQQPIIFDFSVDRRWDEFRSQAQSYRYTWCIINMNMSQSFMTNLYSKTKRPKAIAQLPDYMRQHQEFMENFSDDITISIDDEHFSDRLQLAENAVRTFLNSLG